MEFIEVNTNTATAMNQKSGLTRNVALSIVKQSRNISGEESKTNNVLQS